jgi:hypothetical protein
MIIYGTINVIDHGTINVIPHAVPQNLEPFLKKMISDGDGFFQNGSRWSRF